MAQVDRSITSALLGAPGVLAAHTADVGRTREARRRRKLWRLAALLAVPNAWLWYRTLDGRPFNVFAVPHVSMIDILPIVLILSLPIAIIAPYLIGGRSPHVSYDADQIPVSLADVKGIDAIKEEVVRSLNLFLAHKTFAAEMGGTPRRGLLFEGAPGTGKTHLAKAMAHEAGVPFLFVSATAFQSMFYGATARKIRSYFKALRKAARESGGAIGFIEEIDAIASRRSGLSMTPESGVTGFEPPPFLPALPGVTVVNRSMMSEGTGGVVNELLVQMQSFDELTGSQRLAGKLVDAVNSLLPATRQLRKPVPPSTNVLLIAATNRADNLDPALLRPGRFDRRLAFDLPAKPARRELIDYFLGRKAHDAELDEEEKRDALAAVTNGYTPVMIEHLLDEALVSAVRRGAPAMSWKDVETARLTEEVGLKQPVAYTERERVLIATHESGHAVAAYLTPVERRLEVLSIIKRRGSLGLLAHGDANEEYTRSRTDMVSFLQIALAGMCAEEIWFGESSTGPGGDLLYATNVAAEMVGSVGMAGSLVSFAAIQGSALNDTNIVGRVLADADGRARVDALLNEQKAAVTELLERNRHLVEALRDALLDREELIGREITDVLEAASAAATVRAPARVRPVARSTGRVLRRSTLDLRGAADAAVDVEGARLA